MPKKRIIITIALIATLLGVANIVASSAIANTGSHLQELQQEANQLEAQTHELERSIAANESLLRIEVRAQELGFTTITSIVTLTKEKPVALLP